MDNIRPNYPPRFEGPDFYNRMPFDDSHHPRNRRHDDRRRYRPEDGPGDPDKPDRKSRWGNSSPTKTDEVKEDEDGLNESQENMSHMKQERDVESEPRGRHDEADVQEERQMPEEHHNESKPRERCTTPLHDEPEDMHQTHRPDDSIKQEIHRQDEREEVEECVTKEQEFA